MQSQFSCEAMVVSYSLLLLWLWGAYNWMFIKLLTKTLSTNKSVWFKNIYVQDGPLLYIYLYLCLYIYIYICLYISMYLCLSTYINTTFIYTFLNFLGWIYIAPTPNYQASLVVQLVKNQPAMRETWVQSLVWEYSLEKGTATHSSILAWRIPWPVHGVTNSRTRLTNFHFHTKLYLYKKGMK